jgi:hypothetical protein
MKFLKYEFANWATEKANIQITNEAGESVWNSDLVAAVVELGKICTQLEVNEQGEEVCVSWKPKYAVDILWQAEALESYNSSVVWPAPCGVHVFAGWEESYSSEYCSANPESTYCQTASEQ